MCLKHKPPLYVREFRECLFNSSITFIKYFQTVYTPLKWTWLFWPTYFELHYFLTNLSSLAPPLYLEHKLWSPFDCHQIKQHAPTELLVGSPGLWESHNSQMQFYVLCCYQGNIAIIYNPSESELKLKEKMELIFCPPPKHKILQIHTYSHKAFTCMSVWYNKMSKY